MASLILSGQAGEADAVKGIVAKLISLSSSRRAMWPKLSAASRADWLDSADDPVMEHLFNLHVELKNLFESKVVDKSGVAPRVVTATTTVAFTDWSKSPILNAAKALFA